ncbi:hypothetical protein [Tepidiforma sp.]|mgnify:CR=1 FL=1|uniref:hypothetical protein n=1 Tax=Tepidiforma sp. TaxID=2682230 RepID=UPI00262DD757|nr:hypothetical protein [Tepidiforma sp.]MCX7616365.1 hypothetical protein [Tepidiforma sp.]
MTPPLPACPDCTAAYEPTDNYCRQCGMYLAALREVAVAPAAPQTPQRYERERAALPAPVKKAVTAVAIGTALQVGMSLTGKYLARQAAKGAVSAVRPKAKRPRPNARQQAANEAAPAAIDDPYADAAAVSETVVIRRVWIRRP